MPYGKPEPLERRKQSACLAVDHNQKQVTQSVRAQKIRLQAEENINSHNQRELNLRISTLKACEPEQIFDNEIQHIVHKALEQMPQQSRTIFMLSRYQNLPNKQIAEQLHVSLKTVEAHITKALRILRLELKDYLASILL